MQKKTTQTLTTSQRVTGIVATAIALIVMIGTVLIVSPPGTALRSEVRSVALPYFSQTWKVFAPSITKSDRTFEIRAQWRDENGNLVKSGWVSITDIELRSVKGAFTPSRIQKSTLNVSQTYLQRYYALDEAQRERVRTTFIEVHGDGFRAIPDQDLINELGADDGDVIRFLRMDYMLMRNATLYATAGFGEKIERVQWRVVRDRPNDFTHRFDDERQFDPVIVAYGWRQATVRVEAPVVSEYRGVIERLGGVEAFEEAADVAE